MIRRSSYRSFPAVLRRRQQLSENFVRLTFAHERLAEFGDTCLDQRIKLVFCSPEQRARALAADDWAGWWRSQPEDVRPVMRTYTSRAVRQAAGEVDVDVVCHGTSGPASRYALTAVEGSEIVLVGPDATVPEHSGEGIAFKPAAAREFLLAGDETALPAIANILQALPATATGAAFLEVASAGDVQKLSHPTGVDLTWLPRDADAGPAGTASSRERGTALSEAVMTWADRRDSAPAGPPAAGWAIDAEADAGRPEGILWDESETAEKDSSTGLYTWAAADAGTVRSLRRGLVRERGFDRTRCSFMGYWKLGAAEGT